MTQMEAGPRCSGRVRVPGAAGGHPRCSRFRPRACATCSSPIGDRFAMTAALPSPRVRDLFSLVRHWSPCLYYVKGAQRTSERRII